MSELRLRCVWWGCRLVRTQRCRCWEDGYIQMHLRLLVADKEPSEVTSGRGRRRWSRRSSRGSRAAVAAATGTCAEALGRAGKGGTEVRQWPVAATTALPRHVREREVRGRYANRSGSSSTVLMSPDRFGSSSWVITNQFGSSSRVQLLWLQLDARHHWGGRGEHHRGAFAYDGDGLYWSSPCPLFITHSSSHVGLLKYKTRSQVLLQTLYSDMPVCFSVMYANDIRVLTVQENTVVQISCSSTLLNSDLINKLC